MKKLIAILLSVLMLCSVIPFAAVSVSAADDYYIELVADAEELNAGDEFTIEVSLYGHESVGLIGAIVKLDYDRDVFEQVATYDEDEEMWIPVEVGPKFSASSNKYITFPPVDEETGEVKSCLATYLRSTATASQAVKTNLFYTATFRVKDDAPSGNYTFNVTDHNDKNIILHGNQTVAWSFDPIEVTVNGSEPSCEHEYEYDCSKNCKLCGEETRPEAEHEFFNDCETVCMICYEEVREASHNVIHVEAKTPTCTAEGNLEYWYCDKCGAAWLNAECTKNTNLKAVKLPMADHTYTDDCDATCNACGAEREVILPAAPIAFGGNSISEKKNGLAFLFTADVDGIIINDNYEADYSNATVIINGEEHKLVAMGAIVNNKGYAEQTLENVDGRYVLNVEANKAFDVSSYAVRIVNIPAEKLDATITARSYLTYECDGELITIYGEDTIQSYNGAL